MAFESVTSPVLSASVRRMLISQATNAIHELQKDPTLDDLNSCRLDTVLGRLLMVYEEFDEEGTYGY